MDYKEITETISGSLAKIRKENPDLAKGFSALAQAGTKDGALDKKTKELIAMGIAIAVRCQGCIGFHAKTLRHMGVSREEFMELLSVATYMGGGPSYMTAAEALVAFEQFEE